MLALSVICLALAIFLTALLVMCHYAQHQYQRGLARLAGEALQTRLNNAEDGELILLSGDYLLTHPLKITKEDIELDGCGCGARIERLWADNKQPMIHVGNVQGVSITGIMFDCQGYEAIHDAKHEMKAVIDTHDEAGVDVTYCAFHWFDKLILRSLRWILNH